MFQSSPTPKGECDSTAPIIVQLVNEFQSSPTPKGECDCGMAERCDDSPSVFAHMLHVELIAGDHYYALLDRCHALLRVRLPLPVSPIPEAVP